LDLICYSCLLRQLIDLLSCAKVSSEKSHEVFFKVYDYIKNRPLDKLCLQIGNEIYLILKEETGIGDPCREIKDISNKLSLEIYPWLKKIVQNSKNKLETALKIAIAGNVIDVGAGIDLDLRKAVEQTIIQDIDERYYRDFVSLISNANNIIFLADNAGEVVFDRVFLEEIKKVNKNKIYYVVKDKPYLNDALRNDAICARIDKIAEVISNSSDYAGTQLDKCHSSFLKEFSKADLIISKGYANYMSLKNVEKPIFFLFKIKCPLMQDEFNVKKGSIIFKNNL